MTKDNRDESNNRILGIIFKLLLYVLLVLVCFLVGIFIGYVIVGGGKYWEVFNINTWHHIRDFIK